MKQLLASTMAVASLLALQALPAQRSRPTVAVLRTTWAETREDSALVATAIRRGLERDSLVEIVERPAAPSVSPRTLQPAQYMLTSVMQVREGRVMVAVRCFNTLTSHIAADGRVVAMRDGLADSVEALGRRVAAQLAGATTPPSPVRRPR